MKNSKKRVLNYIQESPKKSLHYFLLGCIILLQVLVLLFWYNENKLEESIEAQKKSRAAANLHKQLSRHFFDSQIYFNHYLRERDSANLSNYYQSSVEMKNCMDSLSSYPFDFTSIKASLKHQADVKNEIALFKKSLVDIINLNSQDQNIFLKKFDFKSFNFDEIVNNIEVDSIIQKDSIRRKSFFARLGDAFIGKSSVQKEQLRVVISMKYDNKVKQGNIENQLAQAFKEADTYYHKQFNDLKSNYKGWETGDNILNHLNNELLQAGEDVLLLYDNKISELVKSSQNQFDRQYSKNKKIYSFLTIVAILLMLLISLSLIKLTNITFAYKQKLENAQQQIKQSLIFKNKIMGMISHEIRSPLSILSYYGKTLSSEIKEPELKELFSNIQFTTDSLLLLSNQILEYSKNEHGQLTLTPKSFLLQPSLNQIIQSLQSLAEPKNNTIELQNNVAPDCKVFTDEVKICQLFYNIVGNANKFTQNGTIRILINTYNVSLTEMALDVEISDTGIGIHPKELEHVFSPYYQSIANEEQLNLGVGLGLNLCKELVDLYKGTIQITSEIRKGTTVRFTLYLQKDTHTSK